MKIKAQEPFHLKAENKNSIFHEVNQNRFNLIADIKDKKRELAKLNIDDLPDYKGEDPNFENKSLNMLENAALEQFLKNSKIKILKKVIQSVRVLYFKRLLGADEEYKSKKTYKSKPIVATVFFILSILSSVILPNTTLMHVKSLFVAIFLFLSIYNINVFINFVTCVFISKIMDIVYSLISIPIAFSLKSKFTYEEVLKVSELIIQKTTQYISDTKDYKTYLKLEKEYTYLIDESLNKINHLFNEIKKDNSFNAYIIALRIIIECTIISIIRDRVNQNISTTQRREALMLKIDKQESLLKENYSNNSTLASIYSKS